MCTENEETVKNTKRTYMSQSRHNMARARLLYDTWPGGETRLSLRTCVRSEAELAARTVAAKRIAAGRHVAERAFIPALAAPVLQTAAAQACALMSLCPMAWILLACLVALVGALAACDWWPLTPHLRPSAAGRSGGAQPAAAAAFEPSSRRARSRRSSSRRRNRAPPSTWPWPLAMCLIIAGFGSCAAYQFTPALTQSHPPSAPNSPTGGASLSMVTASLPTGTVMRPSGKGPGWTPSDEAVPLVLHGQQLNEVSLSTVVELIEHHLDILEALDPVKQMSTARHQQSEAEELVGGSDFVYFDVEGTFETDSLDAKRLLSHDDVPSPSPSPYNWSLRLASRLSVSKVASTSK